MKDIILSALVLVILSIIARTILPKIKILVKWIIKVCVKFAEKKVKGSHMGEIKKTKVLKWLKWFGIASNGFVDELIEAAVEVMNAKKDDIKLDIKDDVSVKFDETIDNITKK
jgi:hypothetical protein